MTDPEQQKIQQNSIKLSNLASYLKLDINPDFCYHVAKEIFRMYDEYWIVTTTNDSQTISYDKLV